MIEPQFAARKVAWHFVDAGGDLRALADSDKLRQILLNLLSNAVKFTPEGGSITVDIPAPTAQSETLFVRVTDTGIGIPADKAEAIFEPFVQVRSERTRAHDGVGLGLAISRSLAQAMGGNVRVRSAPGSGSTFTISLRRAPTGALSS
jgi:signal transduction histidine kinase